jgi:hypothetical protein
MSSQSTVEAINAASQRYIIYVSFVTLLAGIIGHVINILVFTSSRVFRRNQSAFYLTADSIVNCFQLLIPMTARLLINGFSIASIKTSLIYCKIRQSVAIYCTLLSLTIVSFSAIDQYLSTNPRPFFRQISTLKLAHYLIFIAAVIWMSHAIPSVIFLSIVPTYGCQLFNNGFFIYMKYFYYLALTGSLPIIVSFTFATLAYLNVRHIVRHQLPVFRRRLDKQLTSMIFVRVAVLVSFTVPYVIERVYMFSTLGNESDPVKTAITNLVDNIMVSIFYLNYSV